jgi:hypothetical protein
MVIGFKKLILVLLIGFCLTGCTDPGGGDRAEFLVQVGESGLTAEVFNQAFDMSGYDTCAGIKRDSHQVAAARLHLRHQLTEELIIIERARELKITVADSDLETEISNIKKAYPGNTFDKTLLENAIFFQAWRERLQRQMLMKKVIEKELEAPVLITPDDIKAYYNDLRAHGNERAGQTKGADEIAFETVLELRRGKAIQAYQPWIKALYGKYQIKVNQPLWDQIIDSSTGDMEDGGVPD